MSPSWCVERLEGKIYHFMLKYSKICNTEDKSLNNEQAIAYV